ncbi:MAG: GGDEF domain-containing protein [Saccharospirillaceae bacterium]|nr:bifunctional diguanylate cyclase/phosphodiesterase [Pseudomonadales bacterium]NRB78627.1 GGDEF domain-containing protein [Saccharospirillaceae bacterium]
MKITKSLWFATVFVFLVGVAVSVFSMFAGRDLIHKVDDIVSNQIPQTEAVISLSALIIKHERVLYACFVNQDDSSELAVQMTKLQVEIQNKIQSISHSNYYYKNSFLLKELFTEIEMTSAQLEQNLNIASQQAANVNLLNRITKIGKEIDIILLQMRNEISSFTNIKNINNQSLIEQVINIIVGFSVVVLVFVMLFVMLIRKQREHNRSHELLRTFPELNPSPVLSINKRMSVEYLNPAGKQTLNTIFGQSDTPAIFILPKDYTTRLNYMKDNEIEFDRWIEDINGIAHQYKVHNVKQHEEFHIYIENIQIENDRKERLQYFAFHDPNTGLPNRRKLEENIESFQNIQNTLHTDIYLGMLQFVGVSHVLSALGKKGVELFYEQVIERINHGVREVLIEHDQEESYLYQYEGSILSILIVDHGQSVSISNISHKLENVFKQAFYIQNQQFNLQIQQGFAKAQMHDRYEEILRHAFTALHSLYFQKSQNIAIYNVKIGQKIKERYEIEQNLRKAIEADQLFLVFQPQISLVDNQITGFEALLRWKFENKYISPATFIPIAEESNLIFSIGDWVLEHSIMQAKKWLDQRLLVKGQKVAINVSVKQFMRNDFVDAVTVLLKKYNVPGHFIELELTESLYVDDIEVAINRMKSIRELNISLALDDFGTGYCSFSYLGRYPVDKMKIDKAFVDGIGQSEDDAVLYAMIEMGHVLNMQVLTEGVESEEQAKILKNFGCDSIQGYLFSKPIRENEATLLLMYFQLFTHKVDDSFNVDFDIEQVQQAEKMWANMHVPKLLAPIGIAKH